MKRIILLTLCLIFSTSVAFSGQWSKSIPLDGDSKVDFPTDNRAVLDSIDRLMSNYKRGMRLDYASTSSITVSAGEVVVSNAAGSVRLFLNNTAATTVTFADIDTGAEAASTTYYVYAGTSTSSDTSATFYVSASSSAPSGVTYYKRLGSFYNNSSSNIDQFSIDNDSDITTLKVYDSGWFSATLAGTYTKTHNLGSTNIQWQVQFSTSSSGANAVYPIQRFVSGEAGVVGVQLNSISSTSVTAQVGSTYVCVKLDSSGNWVANRYTSGYIRIIGQRLD